EERGQAAIIAENLMAMSQIDTPIVCVVIGEGGSGGALGIGIGDRVAMFAHAYYSVISPEGCASILWKTGDEAPRAADALKFTARRPPLRGNHRGRAPGASGGRAPPPRGDRRDAQELRTSYSSRNPRVAPRPAPRPPLREVSQDGGLRREAGRAAQR